MIEHFKERILLPFESDGSPLKFMADNGTVIADGYSKIFALIQGLYIEFLPSQFYWRELGISLVDNTWKESSGYGKELKTISYCFKDDSELIIHQLKNGNFWVNALMLKSTVPIALSLNELEAKKSKVVGSLW